MKEKSLIKYISKVALIILLLSISIGCSQKQTKNEKQCPTCEECKKCEECQECENISCDNGINSDNLDLYQKAAILMEKYHVSSDINYIDSLDDEDTKDYLALSKIFNNTERHDYCKYLDEKEVFDCEMSEHVFFKSYTDVLLAKQLLFGDNETIEKRNFEYGEYSTFFNYYYIPELNGFLETIAYGGSGVLANVYGEKVLSVKIDEGKLKVKTYKYFLKPLDIENYDTDYELGTSPNNLFGIKIKYKDINSEVIKYIDKFEQQEYTFDKYNTSIQYLDAINLNYGYSLIEIKKIK